MYQVIGTRASRAFRVLWMLEEIGAPYEHIAAAPRSAEVQSVNPLGKIPALRVGDACLTDSVAIMTYLGDRHGTLTHPAGSLDRARQDALTHRILDELDAVLWTAARHSFVLPEDRRVPQVKETLRWEYETNIGRMDGALEGPFLQGETMTIADILLVHCLLWAGKAGFPAPSARLSEYAERMMARPAFQRAAALP